MSDLDSNAPLHARHSGLLSTNPPHANDSKSPRAEENTLASISKPDRPLRMRLQTLMQQGDNYAKKLDSEKNLQVKLDVYYGQLQSLQLDLRNKIALGTAKGSNLKGSSSSSAPQTAVTFTSPESRGIRTLENRLEKLITRYNKLVSAVLVL